LGCGPGNVAGCLYVANIQAGAFDEDQVRILYAAAGQAATAIQRLRSFLVAERAQLEAVVSGLDEGVVLLNESGKILLSNPTGEKLLTYLSNGQLSSEESLNAVGNIPFNDVIALTTNQPEGLAQIGVLDQGSNLMVQIQAKSISVHNEPAILLLLKDITKRHQYEQTLRELSLTDPLTGLANRRKFFDVLKHEISRARRYDTSLSLVMADMDDLKQINDTYGHQAGDEALQKVAQAFRCTVRTTDLPARYAGDEFIILLPNTSLADGRQLAKRLLSAVRQLGINGQNLSISFGVTRLSSDDDDLGETFVARADQALYSAKQNGRSCITIVTAEGKKEYVN